jgi:hypothetical protein
MSRLVRCGTGAVAAPASYWTREGLQRLAPRLILLVIGLTVLKAYVTWRLIDGQEFSESLGFVRLPPRIATHGVSAVGSLQ